MLNIDMIVPLIVEWWIKAYHRKPVLVVSIMLFIFVGVAIVTYQDFRNNKMKHEAERLKNQSYVNQIVSLDQVRYNLENLLTFVDEQRVQLKKSEDALVSIKNEHEKMKPLIEIDRKVIDALFSAQESRNKEAQTRERWIGFGLGVAASLIASIVWAIVSYTIRRRNRLAVAQAQGITD